MLTLAGHAVSTVSDELHAVTQATVAKKRSRDAKVVKMGWLR
jgi:hypothetical protein